MWASASAIHTLGTGPRWVWSFRSLWAGDSLGGRACVAIGLRHEQTEGADASRAAASGLAVRHVPDGLFSIGAVLTHSG